MSEGQTVQTHTLGRAMLEIPLKQHILWCILLHGWSASIVLTSYPVKFKCEVLSDSQLEYNDWRTEGSFLKNKKPKAQNSFFQRKLNVLLMQILHLFPNMQFLQFGQTASGLQSKDPVVSRLYTEVHAVLVYIVNQNREHRLKISVSSNIRSIKTMQHLLHSSLFFSPKPLNCMLSSSKLSPFSQEESIKKHLEEHCLLLKLSPRSNTHLLHCWDSIL